MLKYPPHSHFIFRKTIQFRQVICRWGRYSRSAIWLW